MCAINKRVFLSLLLGAMLTGVATADTFPERSVRIVVPYTPGGFNDTLARVVGERLSKIWNQPVLVDNRPGGNTTIGNLFVAKSPPDGYTILISPLPFSALPGLYGAQLPYDALKDFSPLIWAGSTQNVLTVRNDLPVNNVKELLDYAKKNPGKLNVPWTHAMPRIDRQAAAWLPCGCGDCNPWCPRGDTLQVRRVNARTGIAFLGSHANGL